MDQENLENIFNGAVAIRCELFSQVDNPKGEGK